MERKTIIGMYSLQKPADNLEKPWKIMMMVKARQTEANGSSFTNHEDKEYSSDWNMNVF